MFNMFHSYPGSQLGACPGADGVAWEVQQQQRSFWRSLETSVGHGISFLPVAWRQLPAASPIWSHMAKMRILQKLLRAVWLKGDNGVIKLVWVKESGPEHPILLGVFGPLLALFMLTTPIFWSRECVVRTWTPRALDSTVGTRTLMGIHLNNWLVVWNIFIFPYIGFLIIPTD